MHTTTITTAAANPLRRTAPNGRTRIAIGGSTATVASTDRIQSPIIVQRAGAKHSRPLPSLSATAALIRREDAARSARTRHGRTGFVHEVRHRGIAVRVRHRSETAQAKRTTWYTLSSPRRGMECENTDQALADALHECFAAAIGDGAALPAGGRPGPLL